MAKGVRPRKNQANPPYSKVNTQGCVLDLLRGHPKKPAVEKDNLDVTKKLEAKIQEMKQPVSNIGPMNTKRTSADVEDDLDAPGFSVNSDNEKEENDLDMDDYDCGEEEASDVGDQASIGSSFDSGGEDEDDEDSDGAYYEFRTAKQKTRVWNIRGTQKKPSFT